MGQQYLIDANVIIDYTADKLDDKASSFVENIFNTGFNISVIVKIEVLGYNDVPAKMQLLEEFVATAHVFSFDDAITQKTIELRRIKKLKLGDAVIAATALFYNLKLITHNTADFKNIENLACIDPYSF